MNAADKKAGAQCSGEMIEDFDREFNLSSLLPAPQLKRLFAFFKDMDRPYPFVIDKAGEMHFAVEPVSGPDPEILKNAVSNNQGSKICVKTSGGEIALAPFNHEMEVVGFLGLTRGPDSLQEPFTLHMLDVLHQFMSFNHKMLMTSSLHGQVVEASFEKLEKQNRLLAESEQRYKRLADSLKEEVDEKTEKIRKAQAMLLMGEKMASIGQLAAGVAHEINNPMGFIASNLSTLKSYVEDIKVMLGSYRTLVANILDDDSGSAAPPRIIQDAKTAQETEKDLDLDYIFDDLSDLIEESEDGADRIKKIVSDLKDFAHPGKHELKWVDLNKVLDSVLNILRNEIKYKAEVSQDYGELRRTPCYVQQVAQVFMNIIANAAQAIESCGEIGIKTYMQDDFTVVEISDNGKGIEQEHLSKVFDPFFTTKEVGKGTGLGLNVAYQIISRHKGEIEVSSSPGAGACFTIKLPIVTEEKADAEDQCLS